MRDPLESLIDGSYLLPSERLTPDNISLLQQYAGEIDAVSLYMGAVQTAMFNYQLGFTSKIVLNPTDIQAYIQRIREITVRMAGGYDNDGETAITPLAASIIPDILVTLRENQLTLCQLYALSQDSQGTIVGPLDKVQIEDTVEGEDAV